MTARQIRMLIMVAGAGLAILARYLFGAEDELVQQLTSALGGGAIMSQLIPRAGDARKAEQ